MEKPLLIEKEGRQAKEIPSHYFKGHAIREKEGAADGTGSGLVETHTGAQHLTANF